MSESSSDDSDSEDSNKQEDIDNHNGPEGKLRSGKVRKKEPDVEESAEVLQEVSSRGRIRKRKIIPNGAEDEAAKKGKLIKENSPSPTPNILQKNKGSQQVITSQGVKMTNLGQFRFQQPQGVSLLGGNQTLLIQGIGGGAQPKGPNSALAMKNSTLFAQLTNKNPAQTPQAQQISLKPGQNVNEVIKALLASGKQVAITANPQQLQMIAAQQQPKAGTSKVAVQQQQPPLHPQQLVLAPQQAVKQQVAVAQVSPAILKPRPAPVIQSPPDQSAIASILSSPQKTAIKPAVGAVATSNVGGTQYFSYNNLGQLPANVIQELLKKQNARLAGTAKAPSTVSSSPPSTVVTSTALTNVKPTALLLPPGVVNPQPSITPNVLLQKGLNVSPNQGEQIKPVTSVQQPVTSPTSVLGALPASVQNYQNKAVVPSALVNLNMPVNPALIPSVGGKLVTTAQLLLLGSSAKPKYAGNVTVKTLLENRAAVGRDDRPAPVLLNPGILQANASAAQLQATLTKPLPVPAVINTATTLAPASAQPIVTGTGLPISAAMSTLPASVPLLTGSSHSITSTPPTANVLPVETVQINAAQPIAGAVTLSPQGDAAKGNVIAMPRLLLQGSTQIGQIPAHLMPAAVGGSKVTGTPGVIGGQQIRALITGGGKGPQVTTITTSQLQAAIAKKKAIDNAVKAVFTTGVSTSLPTAQIKVNSPFAMPSRNPHRPVTITTSAMKAPIPALPQITSNERKNTASETSSVHSVQGSLTMSALSAQTSVSAQSTVTENVDSTSANPMMLASGEANQTVPIANVNAEGPTAPREVSPVKTLLSPSTLLTSPTAQVKPLAVKVTSQNIRTSQGVVPGVILPQGVTIPPQVLQQIASKQPGVVFLQQGKDGAMQIIQVPNSQANPEGATVEHVPGKLELPRVPTPTILKPAVPSEAANLQQQKLLQQQAAAAKGIVSHQVSATAKQMTLNQPPVVSPSNTTLSPQELVSPTSVTVLPTQAVAIKGQAGTQIVSPTGNQMIASQLLLAATSIQQQQLQKQTLDQTQAAPVMSPVMSQVKEIQSPDGLLQNMVAAPLISPTKIQSVSGESVQPSMRSVIPQVIKLGTVPVSSNITITSRANTGELRPAIIQQPTNSQSAANQKVVIQANLGSPGKTSQLTPVQIQQLQQQLLQMQAKQGITSPAKQQVIQMPVRAVKQGAATGSSGLIQQQVVSAASNAVVPTPVGAVAAPQGKVTMIVPNTASLPNVAAINQATQPAKLVLFNVNGQLVTAQGVPVNIAQGGLKLGSANLTASVNQAAKPGTIIQAATPQTGLAAEPQKQQLVLAGGQVVQPAQVAAKAQPGQLVLQSPQARVLNTGQLLQASNMTTRLPLLQQGQVILQPGQVIGQPGGVQFLSKPVANVRSVPPPNTVQNVNQVLQITNEITQQNASQVFDDSSQMLDNRHIPEGDHNI